MRLRIKNPILRALVVVALILVILRVYVYPFYATRQQKRALRSEVERVFLELVDQGILTLPEAGMEAVTFVPGRRGKPRFAVRYGASGEDPGALRYTAAKVEGSSGRLTWLVDDIQGHKTHDASEYMDIE